MVAAEMNVPNSLFLCPERSTASTLGHPNLMYRSAIDPSIFVPFDPSEYLCCSRRGRDQAGKAYTEYCIEENPRVKSKWSHLDCCGWAGWSTNDGIWRVSDEIDDNGMRTVTLVFYSCNLANELWINGEFVWDDLGSHVGIPLKFKDVGTNYGYNILLSEAPAVRSDTIVLLDYNHLHADPESPFAIADLSDVMSARHLGKMNVLTADGGVNVRGPAGLYPDLNPAPWTPESD